MTLTPEMKQLISEVLFVMIGAGWLILLGIGLEPDKPLSGGLPGHVTLTHKEDKVQEGLLGRLGEILGWMAFGIMSALLGVIMVWITRVHG